MKMEEVKMPKVNTEEGLPSASLHNALKKSVLWPEGWVEKE